MQRSLCGTRHGVRPGLGSLQPSLFEPQVPLNVTLHHEIASGYVVYEYFTRPIDGTTPRSCTPTRPSCPHALLPNPVRVRRLGRAHSEGMLQNPVPALADRHRGPHAAGVRCMSGAIRQPTPAHRNDRF